MENQQNNHEQLINNCILFLIPIWHPPILQISGIMAWRVLPKHETVAAGEVAVPHHVDLIHCCKGFLSCQIQVSPWGFPKILIFPTEVTACFLIFLKVVLDVIRLKNQ